MRYCLQDFPPFVLDRIVCPFRASSRPTIPPTSMFRGRKNSQGVPSSAHIHNPRIRRKGSATSARRVHAPEVRRRRLPLKVGSSLFIAAIMHPQLTRLPGIGPLGKKRKTIRPHQPSTMIQQTKKKEVCALLLFVR